MSNFIFFFAVQVLVREERECHPQYKYIYFFNFWRLITQRDDGWKNHLILTRPIVIVICLFSFQHYGLLLLYFRSPDLFPISFVISSILDNRGPIINWRIGYFICETWFYAFACRWSHKYNIINSKPFVYRLYPPIMHIVYFINVYAMALHIGLYLTNIKSLECKSMNDAAGPTDCKERRRNLSRLLLFFLCRIAREVFL